MCFGQTGAGKTYTMTGSTESFKQRGIIPRALQEVSQDYDKCLLLIMNDSDCILHLTLYSGVSRDGEED